MPRPVTAPHQMGGFGGFPQIFRHPAGSRTPGSRQPAPPPRLHGHPAAKRGKANRRGDRRGKRHETEEPHTAGGCGGTRRYQGHFEPEMASIRLCDSQTLLFSRREAYETHREASTDHPMRISMRPVYAGGGMSKK